MTFAFRVAAAALCEAGAGGAALCEAAVAGGVGEGEAEGARGVEEVFVAFEAGVEAEEGGAGVIEVRGL